MKTNKVFKGFWERWKDLTNPENASQLMQYFKELEVFLRRLFTNRISLSDNVYCRFFDVSNISANSTQVLENAIIDPRRQSIDAILLSQTSEPCDLTWAYTSGVNITYTLHNTGAVSTIPSATLLVFYKDTSTL